MGVAAAEGEAVWGLQNQQIALMKKEMMRDVCQSRGERRGTIRQGGTLPGFCSAGRMVRAGRSGIIKDISGTVQKRDISVAIQQQSRADCIVVTLCEAFLDGFGGLQDSDPAAGPDLNPGKVVRQIEITRPANQRGIGARIKRSIRTDNDQVHRIESLICESCCLVSSVKSPSIIQL